MPASPDHDVTKLLQAWAAGDQAALKELTPLVAGELHRLARHYMRGERVGHTLQATALINEVYLRLIDWRNVRWQDRAHFFAVSARLMRRTLIDHARRYRFRKRGADVERISLDEAVIASPVRSADVIAIDDALSRLSEFDARKGKVVELRFFGGLTVDQRGGHMYPRSARRIPALLPFALVFGLLLGDVAAYVLMSPPGGVLTGRGVPLSEGPVSVNTQAAARNGRGSPAAAPSHDSSSRTIFYNGKVFTSVSGALWAEGVVVSGRHIVAVGTNDDVLA